MPKQKPPANADAPESASLSRSKPRKPKVVLPSETLARAVGMAEVDGAKAAAAFFGVDRETIRRASHKITLDPALRAIADVTREELGREWRSGALRFVRLGLRKLELMVEAAKPEQLRDVAGAVHLVLDKLVMKDLLPNANGPRPARESEKPASAPAVGARAASGTGTAPAASPAPARDPVH